MSSLPHLFEAALNFSRLFGVLDSLGYVPQEPEETRLNFIFRILKKSLIHITILFAVLYQLLKKDDQEFSWFGVVASFISLVFCFTKIVEIVAGYMMAALQVYNLSAVPENSYMESVPEKIFPTLCLHQKENTFRKILSSPFEGPREKSIVLLRNWLSFEIFKPLYKMMMETNAAFEKAGFSDTCLGAIPLPRLEQLKTIPTFVHNYAPKFPLLVKFLSLCFYQQYMVDRLNSLAEGAYLPNFQIPFPDVRRSALPSDSGIIFHCFCVFMDSYFRQHLQHLLRPRPFFEDFVVLSFALPQAVKLKQDLAIHCTDWICPRYNLIIANGGEVLVEEEITDVFAVLVDFFYIIKTQKRGFLAGVDLTGFCAAILCS